MDETSWEVGAIRSPWRIQAVFLAKLEDILHHPIGEHLELQGRLTMELVNQGGRPWVMTHCRPGHEK